MRPLRVLVACEYSGRVREAFRRLGHDAWSCDLLPSEDDSASHIIGDVIDLLPLRWDLMIAHPPCKYLANSGAKHLYIDMKKENGIYQPRWDNMEEGAEFYSRIWKSDIPFIAAENPIWHKHAAEAVARHCAGHHHPVKRQFVQPWWFGHKEVKATGLALKSLPPLVATDNVYEDMMLLPYGQRAKVHHASPGPDRWKDRSRTLEGLADAMAHQWASWVQSQLRIAA